MKWMAWKQNTFLSAHGRQTGIAQRRCRQAGFAKIQLRARRRGAAPLAAAPGAAPWPGSGGGSAAAAAGGTRSRDRAPRQARRCRQCPFKGRRPAPSTAYGRSQERASLLHSNDTSNAASAAAAPGSAPASPPSAPRTARTHRGERGTEREEQGREGGGRNK